jgi:hypothetical protein
MACGQCGSGNQKEFPAEICVHLPDLRNLNTPPTLAFPKLLVCLHCGFTQFALSDDALRLLTQDAPVIASSEVGDDRL